MAMDKDDVIDTLIASLDVAGALTGATSSSTSIPTRVSPDDRASGSAQTSAALPGRPSFERCSPSKPQESAAAASMLL